MRNNQTISSGISINKQFTSATQLGLPIELDHSLLFFSPLVFECKTFFSKETCI